MKRLDDLRFNEAGHAVTGFAFQPRELGSISHAAFSRVIPMESNGFPVTAHTIAQQCVYEACLREETTLRQSIRKG